MVRIIAWTSRWTSAGLTVLMVAIVAGLMTWRSWRPGGAKENPPADATATLAVARSQGRVTLSPAKMKAANIEVAQCRSGEVLARRTVPGYVTFDEARRLSVTLPVACVVKQVLVEPDQPVNEGDELAILSSAEIGLARDDVVRREADLKLAEREEQWTKQIAESVSALLSDLSNRPAMDKVERSVAGRPLGEYRDKILSAYSKLLLAESGAAAVSDLPPGGGVSTRTVQERKNARETAAAQFGSLCETAKFDVEQSQDKAHAVAEQSRRLLGIGRERLAALLGPAAESISTSNGKPLSEFTLVAPRAGRIVRRHAVAGGRNEAGQTLFEVGDTEVLWVSAEIHERDWGDLSLEVGTSLDVRVPALDDRTFHAQVRFVGTEVSEQSRAVPLVAQIDNPEGKLKPGMFAWIDVPTSARRQATVVPREAIGWHEGQAFVFLPEGNGTFRRNDVKTGIEMDDLVEVVRGLAPGQQVVTKGTFYLKSELLLEHEAE